MKKCINCGTPASSNNENWCRYCGGQLAKVSTTTCENCGAVVNPDNEFCQHCGNKTDYLPDTPYIGRETPPYRDSIRREKDNDSKLLTIAVTITAIVCVIATIVLCAVLFSKDDDKKQVKTDIPETETNDTEIIIEDNASERITEKSKETLPALEDNKEKLPEPKKDDSEKTRSPYDYDPDSNDWYRIRKSKNDPSTQVGAYKTLEKALSYAAIYVPQGYTLYDKDFNPIDIRHYGLDIPEPQNNTTTSTGLSDYAEGTNDWYRIRKVKNDPSTQVGAYKTVEKALYYADIYCPQGYTLYDKDFNVIR